MMSCQKFTQLGLNLNHNIYFFLGGGGGGVGWGGEEQGGGGLDGNVGKGASNLGGNFC